jgi:hypothetical protein
VVEMALEDELKKRGGDNKDEEQESLKQSLFEELYYKQNLRDISKGQFIIHISREKLNSSGVYTMNKRQGLSPSRKAGFTSLLTDTSKNTTVDPYERKGFSQITTNYNSLHASTDSEFINNKRKDIIIYRGVKTASIYNS